MIESPAVDAVSSLVAEAEGDYRARMPDDPFAQLLDRLRELIPHRGVSQAARDMHVSVSHLHRVLDGETDASAEVRQKIAEYVAKREQSAEPDHRTVVPGTDPVLARPSPSVQTVTAPVTAPRHPTGQEVTLTVPTPYHAALCDLVSTLSVPTVFALFAEVTKRAREEYDQRQHDTPPPDEPPQPPPPDDREHS